ncbi:aldo/keto reductase [Arthrobacter sp. MMS18-M83]|uniref:aldo/keto reductase n=1 Tax=Arthrobacter sp. MMS18-M83 TaxID=2996261 RepID=UPI00227BE00E|nr:aldo/keto reductase [Arthrobacter sp. MMS18-M83]WAH96216.1 aldo/keto reductase [Arthrobacter sp. MMS18-M83]
MEYRTFGRTGWKVSEIAFGGWQIGGTWGEVDDNESVRTLLYAYEQGINFVDTAELYGGGRSERVIGESLRRWNGDKIYVATKIQPVRWPDADEDNPVMAGRYPSWYLREGVEKALRNLGVERLDLLQLHCWLDDGTSSLDWLETLNELRLEGKIDQIGVSIRDYRPDEGIALAELGLVSSIQVIFNMFEQRPAEALFAAAAKTNTAIIARVPFDSGSLSGTWTEDTYASWEPGSVPAELFRGERFGETLKKVNELKQLVEPHYPSLAEAAMRYSLSAPQVATVIPGMRNPRNIDRNVAYSDGRGFPASLLDEIAPFNWPRNYYK